MSNRHDGPDKDSALESIASYATSSIIRHLGNLATAIVRPMVLSPEYYGLWNLLKTLPNYAQHLDLGVRTAARYDIPYNQGRGCKSENDDIEKTIFILPLFLNLLFCAVLVAYGLTADISLVERAGFCFVAAWIMILWLHDHYLTLLKAYQWFKLISRQNYLAIYINLLTLPLLFLYTIYGLYASILINALLVLVYLRGRYTPRRGGRFSWTVMKKLLRKGLPIMAFTLTFLLLRTVDRFLIIGFLGPEELGYYGIAVMLLTFIMNVPTATREVLEPRLMQNLNAEALRENYQAFFAEPVQSTAVFMGLLSGPVFHLAPEVIDLLLPLYAPGKAAMQVMCLAGYFMALAYIARGLIVALNLQVLAVVFGLVATVVNVLASVAALKLGLGITGIAAGSTLALAVQFEALRRLIDRYVQTEDHSSHAVVFVVTVCFLLLLVFGFCLSWAFQALGVNRFLSSLGGMILYYFAFFGFIQVFASRYPRLVHFTLPSLVRRLAGSVKRKGGNRD